ncbi:MAG: transglycosylase domain-containing protein, partial [Firmicutes bacterium]|nr:transglycosylase domain-containing protein [Bacillota bacterium]
MVKCPKCGYSNPAHTPYCRACGQKLSELPAPTKKSSHASDSSSHSAPRWKRIALISAASLMSIGVVGIGFISYKALSTMPPIQDLVTADSMQQNSVVYDVYNQPVATLHGSVNRIDVPISQIPPDMQHALVSIEDHNFYTNEGFDLTSIARAALVDIIHGAPVQGASTITEQLAKDLYLSDKKTLSRKLKEFIIGLELAHTYSKPQILDMYLNEVYFGNGANGIYAAAKTYFDESPSQLTLAQSSLLAGLPQAPSVYDPLTNLKLAKQRQKQVLAAMTRYGYITKTQAQKAYKASLNLKPTALASSSSSTDKYPWYIDQVVKILEKQGFTGNQIFNGGLKIYTALNPTVYN